MPRRLKTAVLAMAIAGAAPVSAQQLPPSPPAAPTVVLPLAEYNRLLDLSTRPTPVTPAPPAGAVLTSSDLQVRVSDTTAQGTFNVIGQVLQDGVHRVRLLEGSTLVDGTANGRPLPLVAEGTGHAALVQGTGPFALTLSWGSPLTIQPGRASFLLPVPASGTSRATIDVPGDQADVRLSAGLVTTKRVLNGRTIVEATLKPGHPTEVSWSMRDSTPRAAVREVRSVADVLTLVTFGDADVRMASLIDLTVMQGELRTIPVRLPAGYQLSSLTGGTIESSEARDGIVVVTVADPSLRRHQFLVALERPHEPGSFSLDSGLPTLPDVQRERGEVAMEGVGTLELDATEREPLHRIDVRELNPALQSLARTPLLSAFRYQRVPSAQPLSVSVSVKRFGDAAVLAAVADQATATTMVTSEGRALTEIKLRVRNRAQPFLKVTLPPGATLASAEVEGQPTKPALGADGTRVPLLRPGFRPSGPYSVSFVFMHAGTPFAKKGDFGMSLPKMDIPIGLVEWEVFIPETYSAKVVDGNVLDVSVARRAVQPNVAPAYGGAAGHVAPAGGGTYSERTTLPAAYGLPGQIRGRVVDESGTPIPGANVTIRVAAWVNTVATDASGAYVISDVPPGEAEARATLPGFTTVARSFFYNQSPSQWNVTLRVGSLEETLTVASETPRSDEPKQAPPPSPTVLELQRRAAGVLPIRIEVPRAGTSYQFVKPLVIDQDATVSFRYKRR